jgi:hypothetical protein
MSQQRHRPSPVIHDPHDHGTWLFPKLKKGVRHTKSALFKTGACWSHHTGRTRTRTRTPTCTCTWTSMWGRAHSEITQFTKNERS